MAAARRLTGYQRDVAERNVEAILDAAEELLQSQGHANISAGAAQAGGSRGPGLPHLPDRGAPPGGGAGGARRPAAATPPARPPPSRPPPRAPGRGPAPASA